MLRHNEWRKIAKRERRRRIRVEKAIKCKDAEKRAQALIETSPNYESWKREQDALELFKQLEQERINQAENEKWLRAEAVAQKAWRETQQKIERARLERMEQEIRIRKEWEEEQQKIRETQRKLKEMEEEKQRNYALFLEKLELFLNGGSSSLPQELKTSRESKPGCEVCPFFNKTACCRFGDACSRNHVYPGVSKVLLAVNFFTHFDTDLELEYDDSDTYKEYKNFFNDVLPEFEKFGEVDQFKTCNNWERHLRGNVYVQFAHLRDALSAYRALHARWYAGKQLNLSFCNIQSWNNAICGMFLSRKCPKGKSCNFLHVFKNPDPIFEKRTRRKENNSRDKENERNWRWSESPEPVPPCRSSRRSPSTQGSRERSSSRHKRHSRHKSDRHEKKYRRDLRHSSERSKYRSRSRSRKSDRCKGTTPTSDSHKNNK